MRTYRLRYQVRVVWTTLGEISNYGECNNVSVDSITDDDWVLELEGFRKGYSKNHSNTF